MKSRVFKLAPVVTGVLLGLALSSGSALAKGDDDNLQKLGAFKTTGAPAMKTVEQNTKYAENLRKMLKNITLPDGFSIELFAGRSRRAPDGGQPQQGNSLGWNP